MTHPELVERVSHWLWHRCPLVLTEYSHAREIPDVIGWRRRSSYLVDCKISLSDFRADLNKSFRTNGKGMGNYRYYACPTGILASQDLPIKWGLLYVYPTVIKIVKPASRWEEPEIEKAERELLVSALRRVHLRGDLEKIYKPLKYFKTIIPLSPYQT